MVIAVTGANGHIGNNLCRELIKSGHEVRGLINRGSASLQDIPVKIFQGSITNKSALKDLIKGCDVVIHAAAKISIEGNRKGDLYDINVKGTEYVVSVCKELNVHKLIHFSSIHIFNPHPLNEPLNESRETIGLHGTHYDKSKIEAEKIVDIAVDNGLNVITIYPTSVYGKYDYYPSLLGRAIIDLYKRKIPVLPPGGFDFVFIDDVVEGVINAIERGKSGEKYILSGHYISVKKLASIVAIEGEFRPKKSVLPVSILKLLIPFFKIQSFLNGKPPVFTRESLQTLVESNPNIDSQKAISQLGYSKTDIKTGIKETLSWFKSQGMI